MLSFTPKTIVASTSVPAGAEINTLLAPDFRCCSAPSLLAKIPVHSSTISMFKSFQGSFEGSFSFKTIIFSVLSLYGQILLVYHVA